MTGYDVVVVGARVAGASTAMLLARAGLRVALLDRSGYGTDTVSTHALMRAGVLQLSRWGLLDGVAAAGTPPVRTVSFHYPDHEPVRVSLRPSPGVDALYAPRRHLLDRLLVDAAAESGVEVRHRTTVTGLLHDQHGRVIGVRTAEPPFEVRARFTVGADGIRSLVAREAGASVVQQGRAAGAVLYRYVSGLPDDGYVWAYGTGAAAGLIATDGGQTCVFVATSRDRMRALRGQGSEAAFRRLLDDTAPAHAERVADAEPADGLHGWVGVPGFVRRSAGAGWALVGDAGYFKDPITTHGITDALRDAELLADELIEVLVGGAPAAVALARYQATRDRLSRDLRAATEAVAGYDWTPAQVQGLLRRVSSAMSEELEHLQARPDRGMGTGISGIVRPDSVGGRT